MTTKTATGTSLNTSATIPPGKLGYTRLYLDFLTGKSLSAQFYPGGSVESIVAEMDRVRYQRAAIADILTSQNRSFGASESALDSVNRLRDERSVCIFAGQQAGLFGGPLFTLIKALAIAKLARSYSDQIHRPVIPVFWIAGDDHDFAEINHTFVPARQGGLSRVVYEIAPAAMVPAAEVRLDDEQELDRVVTELGEQLGTTDFTPALLENLRRAYTRRDTFVSAFGKLMAALTAEYGLVLFNPGDPEVKRLAAPVFQTLIEQQVSIRDKIAETNGLLQHHGYHLQVEKKDDAAHLFCNLDGRVAVVNEGGGFSVGDRKFSRPELLKLLQDRPEIFSPDVLTRPLLQAWLFPVAVQMGGPSEIAYFAQLNGLFSLIDRPVPKNVVRPSLTLIERRTEQLMNDMSLTFEDFLGDIEQVVNKVLGQSFPADLQSKSSALREAVEERFRRFADDALSFDPGLKETAEQVRGKIDYLLNGFESKIFAAHKKKSQHARERIYRIGHALYPRRGLQERTLNISYFISRYGPGVIKYLYEHMNADESAHQLISLREYEP